MMVPTTYKERILRPLTAALATAIALVSLAGPPALAAGPAGARSFASPQQAVAALVAAVQANNDASLLAILGPGAEDLISSGDKVADQNGRDRFLTAYQEKNSLEEEAAGRVILLVGNKEYPFPFPLLRQGEAWLFNTEAGRQEILNRRIGRNELHTMAVLQAYTEAQREYACMPHHNGQEFAQKFASSPGKKDGLYWPVEEGEPESPFGPLIARATQDGYGAGLDEKPAEPFHGYYFKILTAQGEHASGGAFDYVVDGKMVLGFALLAYPAKYGVSGIMTFLVNQEGIIYEKDLGEATATAAPAMATFDPDSSWRRDEESAGP